MRTLLLVVTVLICVIPVATRAQDDQDPFDISAIVAKIEQYGVPTAASVAQLETKANTLFDQGDYAAALDALDAFAKHANWLANLISGGLEPYYSASYDDKKGFSYTKLSPLVEWEKKANQYKSKRNRAMVMQAECASKIGDKSKAVALYVKALDLISLDEEDLWVRARTGLYQLIGI